MDLYLVITNDALETLNAIFPCYVGLLLESLLGYYTTNHPILYLVDYVHSKSYLDICTLSNHLGTSVVLFIGLLYRHVYSKLDHFNHVANH